MAPIWNAYPMELDDIVNYSYNGYYADEPIHNSIM